MRKLFVAVAVLITPIGIASCRSTPTTQGTVSGRLTEAGGPAPSLSLGVPGRITLTPASGTRFTTSTNAKGYYTIAVPPGTYTVTGGSPKAQVERGKKFTDLVGYAKHRVLVKAGVKMVNVNVFVSIK